MVFSGPDFHDHLKGENSLILIKTSISVLLTFLNDEYGKASHIYRRTNLSHLRSRFSAWRYLLCTIQKMQLHRLPSSESLLKIRWLRSPIAQSLFSSIFTVDLHTNIEALGN
jgi:hypothetical protein